MTGELAFVDTVFVDGDGRAALAPDYAEEPTVTLSFSAHCLDLHGLTAIPAISPAYSILVLRVNVPGRDKPVFVSIGLVGNGMTARTILDSLRPASPTRTTPKPTGIVTGVAEVCEEFKWRFSM